MDYEELEAHLLDNEIAVENRCSGRPGDRFYIPGQFFLIGLEYGVDIPEQGDGVGMKVYLHKIPNAGDATDSENLKTVVASKLISGLARKHRFEAREENIDFYINAESHLYYYAIEGAINSEEDLDRLLEVVREYHSLVRSQEIGDLVEREDTIIARRINDLL